MRILLDSHALLWWLNDSPRLSPAADAAIAHPDHEVLVIAASLWEIAIKVHLGKLPGVPVDLLAHLQDQEFEILPITGAHAQRAGALPNHHKDPFDRMLVAQAQAEGIPLISNEAIFDGYGVSRIW